jgi:hypothetical protein
MIPSLIYSTKEKRNAYFTRQIDFGEVHETTITFIFDYLGAI